MAGVTRLELATSGVTGQRSNQLSYTPLQYPRGKAGKLDYPSIRVNLFGLKKVIRATDAKEVGVENPSEETFCRPDQENWCAVNLPKNLLIVNPRLENNRPNHFFP